MKIKGSISKLYTGVDLGDIKNIIGKRIGTITEVEGDTLYGELDVNLPMNDVKSFSITNNNSKKIVGVNFDP